MRDADIEAARLQETADRLNRIERKGTCTHGHHRELLNGTYVCLRCGEVFPNEETAFTAYEQYL